MTTIYDLPEELLNVILDQYLPVPDIITCHLTDELFHVLYPYQVDKIKIYDLKHLIECCEQGYIVQAQYLYNNYIVKKIKKRLDITLIFKVCCENNQLQVAQWLHQLYLGNPKIKLDIHANEEVIFRNTCFKGHLVLAKWLYDLCVNTNKPIDINSCNNKAFKESLEKQNFDVTKWLYKLNKDNKQDMTTVLNDRVILHSLCRNGNLIMIKWIYKKLGKNMDIHHDEEDLFVTSCEEDYLELAQWFWKTSIEMGSPININEIKEDIFVVCCRKGHIQVLKWLCYLCKSLNLPIDISYNDFWAFRSTSTYGHFEVIKLIYDLAKENDITIPKMVCCDTFIQFCYSAENLEHVKQLYEITIKYNCIIDSDALHTAFVWSCRKGILENAKWLYSLGIETNTPININYKQDKAFRWACRHCHLELIEWLYNLSLELGHPIDIHTKDNYAFKTIFTTFDYESNGMKNLNMAKWLYDQAIKLGTSSYIVIDYDIFYNSCNSGNIVCIQWLYNMSIKYRSPINIRENNDDIFKFCCARVSNYSKYLDIVKWLCTICDNYSITISNGNIQYKILD